MDQSFTALRAEVKQQIDRLSQAELSSVFALTSSLLSKRNESVHDPVRQTIATTLAKDHLKNADKIRIDNLFRTKWRQIKEGQTLTKASIQYFEHYNDYEVSRFLRRSGGDGRTGYAFEDKFGIFLKLYLQSKKELYNKKVFPYELKVNEPMLVDGMDRPQKPDICIVKAGKPMLFLELKKGFTKASLKHTYDKQKKKWQTFPGASFLFIIFSASATKLSAYQKPERARVICTGLRTTSTQRNQLPDPQVCSPIEILFEEIYSMIRRYDGMQIAKQFM